MFWSHSVTPLHSRRSYKLATDSLRRWIYKPWIKILHIFDFFTPKYTFNEKVMIDFLLCFTKFYHVQHSDFEYLVFKKIIHS